MLFGGDWAQMLVHTFSDRLTCLKWITNVCYSCYPLTIWFTRWALYLPWNFQNHSFINLNPFYAFIYVVLTGFPFSCNIMVNIIDLQCLLWLLIDFVMFSCSNPIRWLIMCTIQPLWHHFRRENLSTSHIWLWTDILINAPTLWIKRFLWVISYAWLWVEVILFQLFQGLTTTLQDRQESCFFLKRNLIDFTIDFHLKSPCCYCFNWQTYVYSYILYFIPLLNFINWYQGVNGSINFFKAFPTRKKYWHPLASNLCSSIPNTSLIGPGRKWFECI